MSHRVALLGALEAGALVLRRLGLGPLVDRVGRAVAPTVGTFTAEVDGLTLHGEHIGQLYYVRELLQGDREATFVSLLVDAIRPGDVVVEAGAHIGYVTLQAARAVGPEGQVVAFEASPASAPLVERNAAANGLDGRVTVVPLALTDAVGRAVFHLSGGGDTSSLHRPDGPSEVVSVETTSLDAWLPSTTRVAVVKLDIEGGEIDALRGMRETLRRSLPHVTLFVECNPDMLARAGGSAAELVGLLDELGFEVEWIDEGARTTRPLDELELADGYVNLVARAAATG